jgi:glycosyltransferase involved in cell wall biosynthesis
LWYKLYIMKKIVLILLTFSSLALRAQSYNFLGEYDWRGTPLYLEAERDTVSIETVEMISNSLPESYPVPDYNPQYITSGYDTDIKLTKDADVWITFISEGAGYRNVLGFYTYDLENPQSTNPTAEEITIIFPNASALGSGGGLSVGDKVKIGSFKAGTGIGWVLLANAWSERTETVGNGLWQLFSNPNFNPEANESLRHHNVLLADPDNERVILIQKRCVGVVIPCYNEEDRLLSTAFLNFIDKNSGYHLCFVNDGSKDNTLQILNKLKEGREDFITVYDCEKNGGKAEAVRLGMLHMVDHKDLDYIGFLDADLSTDLTDFDELVTTIENSDYKIVSGSRISRMGANITKESARKIISLTVNFIIRKILSMDFKDTQCGAKIFHKDVINICFRDKFITQWIFDVEIFKRVTHYFGLERAKEILCEKPLKRWIHADGSKLSMKDSVKIIGQLGQIAWSYRKLNTLSEINVFDKYFVIRDNKFPTRIIL